MSAGHRCEWVEVTHWHTLWMGGGARHPDLLGRGSAKQRPVTLQEIVRASCAGWAVQAVRPPALWREVLHFRSALLCRTAIWYFDGIYASSRHIPGVRFAGLIHPGLIGEWAWCTGCGAVGPVPKRVVPVPQCEHGFALTQTHAAPACLFLLFPGAPGKHLPSRLVRARSQAPRPVTSC